MFGIGFGELLVIGVVAVLVFGPDKLPEVAKQAGGLLRTLRQLSAKAREDLAREMGDDYDELRRLATYDPRSQVRRAILDEPRRTTGPHAAPLETPLGRGELPPFDREAT